MLSKWSWFLRASDRARQTDPGPTVLIRCPGAWHLGWSVPPPPLLRHWAGGARGPLLGHPQNLSANAALQGDGTGQGRGGCAGGGGGGCLFSSARGLRPPEANRLLHGQVLLGGWGWGGLGSLRLISSLPQAAGLGPASQLARRRQVHQGLLSRAVSQVARLSGHAGWPQGLFVPPRGPSTCFPLHPGLGVDTNPSRSFLEPRESHREGPSPRLFPGLDSRK